MIQRKQSLWLFVAALLNACLFYFDAYHAHIINEKGIEIIKDVAAARDYPLLVLALVITLLPMVAIFMFSNRKRQRAMSIVSIVGCLSFISTMLMRVNSFTKDNPTATNGTYWIGAILPLLSTIFLIMAISGINKDEKLVRSQDRLR